jgi:hypothetical protein
VTRTLRQALIAFVATLLVIEVGLQLASLVARPLLARKAQRDTSPNAITILCVGDSHTYGAKLPDEESYPSQLQALLAERYPKWEFNVVNLGFPGVNSAFVANRLESQILQIRPQLVIVSAGANNLWNSIETEAWETETGWGAVKRMLMHVKLFRLATITWSTQTEYHFKPAEEGASRWHHEDPKGHPIPHVRPLPVPGVTYKRRKEEELRGDGLARSIVFDMERIATLTRSYHIPVIWYNYPWPRHFPRVLQTIANTGAQLGIPVLQAERDYTRALADGHTLETLGNSKGVGLHPSGILYGYIVESMVPLVEKTLREWHGIDLRSGPESATPTRDR